LTGSSKEGNEENEEEVPNEVWNVSGNSYETIQTIENAQKQSGEKRLTTV
jgi:hypothetical protein